MENKKYYKKTRFIFSLMKEKLWLEEMANKGYMLRNITLGVRYTFERCEPKHMVFEIDRFDLPKNPTLKEIHQKEEFFALAEEMGWEEITHDEDMNYYFAKEYVEGDINELYNDEDGRIVRANKFKHRYDGLTFQMDKWNLVIGILCILLGKIRKEFWVFGLFYFIFILSINLLIKKMSFSIYNELKMTKEEWMSIHQNDKKDIRVMKRIFFFSRGLEKYIEKQSEKGWHIRNVSNHRYVFKKGEPKKVSYILDSKSAVNKRIKAMKGRVIKDHKDLNFQNNDWQIVSVNNAREHGLTFLCALENHFILYECDGSEKKIKTTNICIHPWFVYYSACFVCGLIIGIIGSFMSVF